MKMKVKKAAGFLCMLFVCLWIYGGQTQAASINDALSIPAERYHLTGTFVEGNNSARYYRVYLPKAGKYHMDLVSEFESRVLVYSAAKEELYSWDASVNDSKVAHTNETLYLEAGTYYIGFGALRGIFVMTDPYGYFELTTEYTAISTNERESNDTIFTPNGISLGAQVNGVMGVDGRDFFRITLPVKNKYTVSCSANMDTEVFIYTPKGDTAESFSEDVDSALGLAVIEENVELEAGTYCILIKPEYGKETGTYSFKMTPMVKYPISRTKVSKISHQTYAGRPVKPYFTVKDQNTTLREGRDYKLSYKNNRKPGKASVTVTGIGDYTGQKTVTFIIKPSSTRITSAVSKSRGRATIRFKKVKGASGYQITCSTTSYGRKREAGITKKNTFTIKKKLSSGRYYYLRVRPYVNVRTKVKGKTKVKRYYGSYSYYRFVRIR